MTDGFADKIYPILLDVTRLLDRIEPLQKAGSGEMVSEKERDQIRGRLGNLSTSDPADRLAQRALVYWIDEMIVRASGAKAAEVAPSSLPRKPRVETASKNRPDLPDWEDDDDEEDDFSPVAARPRGGAAASPAPDTGGWRWKLLEWDYYQDNTRAERFFEHIAEARRLGKPDVPEIFFLCLALGFQGVYNPASGVDVSADFPSWPPTLDGQAREILAAINLQPQRRIVPSGQQEAAGDCAPLGGRRAFRTALGTLLAVLSLAVVLAVTYWLTVARSSGTVQAPVAPTTVVAASSLELPGGRA